MFAILLILRKLGLNYRDDAVYKVSSSTGRYDSEMV